MEQFNAVFMILGLGVGSFVFGFFMQAGVSAFMHLTSDDDDDDMAAV